ncbi:MAG TPA: hypothetical protein VFA09_06280 [Ktedonobacteraceae bacterium]|jgi:hypothetical protein|nr:hypothetical protein [Ktedonobacteraceae bacterium]
MVNSTLVKKLQLKAGQRAMIINPPPGYFDEPGLLPEGIELVEHPEGNCDFVQVFAKNKSELERFLPLALQAVKYDALLWIAYPKGGTKAGTDLNRDILWDAVAQHGYSGVTLVSLNDVWSAMRFRPSEKVGK